MGNRRYDPDFKREAVRLVLVVLEEGMGVREVERNLGITFGVVKGWVQKQRDHQDAAFVGRVAPNSPEGSRAEAMAGLSMNEDGIRIGKNRGWRLMKQHGLRVKTTKRFKVLQRIRSVNANLV